MQCEVCGREIVGKPHRVIIEGAKMVTCGECAKLGSGYWTPEPEAPKLKTPVRRVSGISVGAPLKRKVNSITTGIHGDIEIVERYGLIVRRAREKLGLTLEDLGKKIKEKESVIKKIEGEKIVPDFRLAAKLEHALKIKLLTKVSEGERNIPTVKPKRTVTLGEIVHLKNSRGRKRGDESNNSLS